MKYSYTPKGVCSSKMTFNIENGMITEMTIEHGCNGNLKGISQLAVGRDAKEIICLLEGITCGSRKTSCPDQLAAALKEALAL